MQWAKLLIWHLANRGGPELCNDAAAIGDKDDITLARAPDIVAELRLELTNGYRIHSFIVTTCSLNVNHFV